MDRVDQLNNLLERSLGSLPTPFARLVFLASIYDPYSGRYMHEGWASVAASEEVHRTLEQAHLTAFEDVLSLPLEDLGGQLQEHFTGLGGADRKRIRSWLDTEPFRDAIPGGASSLQREFFISQMRTALWMLVSAVSLEVLPERYASRLQPPAPQSPHQPGT
jgi:hypothetical protein